MLRITYLSDWSDITQVVEINYEGHLIPESRLYHRVKNLCSMFNQHPEASMDYYTYSSIVIDCFRLAVLNGVIAPNLINFGYDDMSIGSPDDCGRLPSWPNGFCDTGDTITTQIILGSEANSK